MEPRFVAARAINFVAGVDSRFWVEAGEIENLDPLFRAEGAGFGTKSLDNTDWVAFPDYLTLQRDVLSDLELYSSVCEGGDLLGKVERKRI